MRVSRRGARAARYLFPSLVFPAGGRSLRKYFSWPRSRGAEPLRARTGSGEETSCSLAVSARIAEGRWTPRAAGSLADLMAGVVEELYQRLGGLRGARLLAEWGAVPGNSPEPCVTRSRQETSWNFEAGAPQRGHFSGGLPSSTSPQIGQKYTSAAGRSAPDSSAVRPLWKSPA